MRNFYTYGMVFLNMLFVNCQSPPKEIFCLEGDRGINFNKRLIEEHNNFLRSVGARTLESDIYLMQDSMKYSKKLVETMSYPDELIHSEGTGYFYEEFLYANFLPAPPIDENALDPVTRWWNSGPNDLLTEVMVGIYGLEALKRGDYQKAGCGLCATFYGHYVTCRYSPIEVTDQSTGSSGMTPPSTITQMTNTPSTTYNPNPTPTPYPTKTPDSDTMRFILIISTATVLGFCILAVGLLIMFIWNNYKSQIFGERMN